MELVLFLLLAIAGAISYQRRLLRPSQAPALPDPERLGRIADRLGMTVWGSTARGTIDGLDAQIEEKEDDRFRITIDSGGKIPGWLRIQENRLKNRRIGYGRPSHRAGTPAPALQTSDRFFDDRFLVFAPAVGAGALLDGSVRRHLLELGRVALEDGVLTATITASRAPAIERAFRQLLEAARSLAATTSYDQRLLATATRDQNPFVRLHALELLAQRRGHSDEAQRALWLALDDVHVPVALFAAIHLGARAASEHLKRLARLAASADDERIAAFRELLEHEKSSEMLPLLIEAARSFYGKFAMRSLAWAVQHGGRDALLILLRDPGATQSENLIAFLEETAKLVSREAKDGDAKLDREMEHAVLRIMLDTRRRLSEAREHAARVLGSYGSATSIAALKEVAKGELGASVSAAKAARDAIASIHSRKSAMSGGLALVDPEGGGDLSFSDAQGGSLSSPPPDAETSR